ncbi:MAG: hypothetical protein ACU0A0_09480 [Limimaricola sp.]
MSHPEIGLIDRLDALTTVTAEGLHEAVSATPDADVLREVADWVETIAPNDILDINRDNRVDDVQPTNFVLVSRFERYEILINHFSAELYAKSRNAPHYHHCDFATRLLCGGYMHVLYDNAGTLDDPDLAVRDMSWIGPGNGYPIGWQTFHTILKPVDGTLSLLVRGPQRCARTNISTRTCSLEMFTAEFDAMRHSLRRAASSIPARAMA